MFWRITTLSLFAAALVLGAVVVPHKFAIAQTLDAPDSGTTDAATDTATDTGTDTGTDTTTDTTTDTIGTGLTSGVSIDAKGVLRRRGFADPTGQLRQQRFAQARATLSRDLMTPSKLRKVSLNRLEKVLAQRLASGQGPTEAMKYLAGMTRLKYVFYYPETHDLVIAGPAEGWFEDISGRVVGMSSGRPVLDLQDLIVALRAFPPTGESPGQVYCSIDPTEEGLARMQQFLGQVKQYFQQSRRPPTGAVTQQIVVGLRRSLGMQVITVGGIPANTHFAEVMVEADYRMKLIGIGLEQPPVRMRSYVSLANPATVNANALQRWYFVPEYQCVRVSGDELAMELVGDGVKLVGQDELVSSEGKRSASGKSSRASELFTQGFTKKYPEIASRAPVYAQLRNLIDLLVAAAFIQQHDLYGQAGWTMPTFGNEDAYAVQTGNVPKRVATAVNSLWKNNTLMTPVGGGVNIHAERALDGENLMTDEKGEVDKTRTSIDIKSLPADSWWWD